MSYYRRQQAAFEGNYLNDLKGQVLACPYLAVNNLNRDFVATRGFSVVFQRAGQPEVERKFPFFKTYLKLALDETCNAFYLNPLVLKQGSRVDPHIDRSLRSYCKTILPPAIVSVLYVQVPENMQGGELVLQRQRKVIDQIRPEANLLLHFQGDLTHSINAVQTAGNRLSLVCEQYCLAQEELAQIPVWTIESRAGSTMGKKQKLGDEKSGRTNS